MIEKSYDLHDCTKVHQEPNCCGLCACCLCVVYVLLFVCCLYVVVYVLLFMVSCVV